MLLNRAAKPVWHGLLAGVIVLASFTLVKSVAAQQVIAQASVGGGPLAEMSLGFDLQNGAFYSNGYSATMENAGVSGRVEIVAAQTYGNGSDYKVYPTGDGWPPVATIRTRLDNTEGGVLTALPWSTSIDINGIMQVSPPIHGSDVYPRDSTNSADPGWVQINLGGGPIDDQAPAVASAVQSAAYSSSVCAIVWCDGSRFLDALDDPESENSDARRSKFAESIVASPDCSTEAYAQDLCFMPAVGLAVRGAMDGVKVVCSGVVVADGLVLTAAHCLCEMPEFVIFGTRAQSMFRQYNLVAGTPGTMVGIGSNYRNAALFEIASSEALNDTDLEDDCAAVAVAGGGGFHNNIDIALIEIKQSGAFSKAQFRAVIIGAPSVGSIVNLAGFGPNPSTTYRERRPGVRRVASSNLTGSGNRGDAGWVVSDPLSESDDALFMQDRNSQSRRQQTCGGDSGSGAFMRLASGRLAVFAILSGGQEKCKVAGTGIFTPLGHPDVRRFLRERGIDLGATGWPQVFAKMECEGQGC